MTTPAAPSSVPGRAARAGTAPVVAIACTFVLLVGALVVGVLWLGERGCTGSDHALVGPLAADPLLATVPPGAVAGDVVSGACDEDEDAAWSARRLTAIDDPAAVVEHYATEGARLGWTAVAADGDELALCLSRPLRDTTAFFTLTRSSSELDATVAADADGPTGCP